MRNKRLVAICLILGNLFLLSTVPFTGNIAVLKTTSCLFILDNLLYAITLYIDTKKRGCK